MDRTATKAIRKRKPKEMIMGNDWLKRSTGGWIKLPDGGSAFLGMPVRYALGEHVVGGGGIIVSVWETDASCEPLKFTYHQDEEYGMTAGPCRY